MNHDTLTASTGQLVAHSEPTRGAGDLFDSFGPDGFAWFDGESGFVTSGVAARVPSDDAVAALEAITHEGDVSAPAPRAIGALPFDPRASAMLTIPRVILTLSANGTWWRTVIGSDQDGVDVLGDSAFPRHDPGRFTVRRSRDRATWDALMRAALDAIGDDRLAKVVLARDATVEADAPFDPIRVLGRLRAQNHGCYVFGDATGPGVFLGASPELLVERRGRTVRSRPMAGTVALGTGDAVAVDAALHTLKHEHEHRLVVDAVLDGLTRCGVQPTAAVPSVVTLSTVAHLVTEVEGTLDTPVDALRLVRALHPTPAVAGTPTEAALAFLDAHEDLQRGRYAGPVGWVDADGDGQFAVALRCAELDGAHAHLFAGAGIVAGSEPASEWLETQAKLEPMLRALVRP